MFGEHFCRPALAESFDGVNTLMLIPGSIAVCVRTGAAALPSDDHSSDAQRTPTSCVAAKL